MRRSLSAKMLLLTLGSSLLMVLAVLGSLYVYFMHFYTPVKITRTIHALNTFAEAYEAGNWSDAQLYDMSYRFMKEESVYLAIYDAALFVNDQDSLTLSIATVTGASVMIGANVNPEEGTAVTVNKAEGPESFDVITSTEINGALLAYPTGYWPGIFMEGDVDPLEQTASVEFRDGVSYVTYDETFSSLKNVMFNKEVEIPGRGKKVIDVNLSLQPAEEVAEVFLLFLPYLMLLAASLSLLIAFVYARTVVRPIQHISSVATRVAAMDWHAVSGLKTDDELGILSRSINTLSTNLRKSMDDLVIANGQLQEDVKQKTLQEQVRREFVANVSHELKTPLTIIKSYAEGLLDGVRTEKRGHYTTVILEEVERMDALVREMLEISKLDAGVTPIDRQVVSLQALVEHASQGIHPIAESRNMKCAIRGTYGNVLVDPSKIGRVLDNLIGNAVRHGRMGTEVVIRGTPVQKGIELSVENECDALSPEQLDSIWNRFYKGDASHSRSTEGAGLGLAIVRAILEGHGCPYGAVNTDSGVRFSFVLESLEL